MGIDKATGMRVLRGFVNDEVPTKVLATTKEIASFALKRAVELTPIATGYMAASWRIASFEDAGSRSFPGRRSEASALSESRAASAGFLASLRFGQSFVLENVAPHAQYIEYGSPTTQAHYITLRVTQAVGGKFGRINS